MERLPRRLSMDAPDGWEDRVHDALREIPRPPEAPPAPPRYEIQARLGEGATAVVYKAWDRELRRPVALKVLRPHARMNDVARERFRREARAAAGLSHPHVVSVHDAVEHEGRLILVLELVDGRPLSEVLESEALDLAARLGILEKTARGVAAAHGKGVVHRDLKPANIFVGAQGEPKVGDFGLAHWVDSTSRLTRTGAALGTPLYMAPEQIEGRSKEVTPRTDVYALGAILYEAVTGRPPHEADTAPDLFCAVIRKEPAAPRRLRPELPQDLEKVILKALAKDPGERYPDAGALAEELRRVRAGEPVAARPPGCMRRLLWRLRRRPGAAVLAAALLLSAGLAAFGWSAWRGRAAGVEAMRDLFGLTLESMLDLRRAGRNARMAEHLPRLEEAYRRAILQAPESAEPDYLMGRAYRALLQPEKAGDFQERALSKEPGFAPALYERTLLKAREHHALQQDADGDLEPGRAEALAGDVAALLEVVRRDADPRIRRAHVLTLEGALHFYRSRFDEARRALEAAVREEPLLEEAWGLLAASSVGDLRRAETAEDRRAAAANAEACLTRALEHDQGYAPHWSARGWSRLKLGQWIQEAGQDPLEHYARAEADFIRALELDPADSTAWYRRGVAVYRRATFLYRRGEDPTAACGEAEAWLERAGSRATGARAQLLSSLCRLRAEQQVRAGGDPEPLWARAEAALASIHDPKLLPGKCSELGRLLLRRAEHRQGRGADPIGDWASAERHLAEGIASGRQRPGLLRIRGQVRAARAAWREAAGDRAGARADCEAAVADYRASLGAGEADVWSRERIAELEAKLRARSD